MSSPLPCPADLALPDDAGLCPRTEGFRPGPLSLFGRQQSILQLPLRLTIVLWQRALAAFALSRSRSHLARLDPRLLDDIGVTPEEAEAEAARKIWNPPGHWRL